MTLQSNLLSNNAVPQVGDTDLTTIAAGFAITFNGGNLAAPANNLVRVTATIDLPTDTIAGACPRLGPLRANGGLTRTHALLSCSPAIDAGNNQFLFFYDQRGSSLTNGTLDYPRVSGASNQPDIGAYEVQQADIVFARRSRIVHRRRSERRRGSRLTRAGAHAPLRALSPPRRCATIAA